MRKVTIVFLLICACRAAFAADPLDRVQVLATRELAKRYAGARIELIGQPKLIKGDSIVDVKSLELMAADGRAQALFKAESDSGEAQFTIFFAAWTMVPIAKQRIQPGEKLSAAMFTAQEINFAQGAPHEQRGLIIPWGTDFSKLETHQTIVEGQYPLWSSVHPIPDVQKSSAVRVRILSGELSLTTQGVTEESALIGSPIHVLAGKNKRELVGTLMSDGSVEVKL